MTKRSGKHHVVKPAVWLAYLSLTLWLSLAIAWKISATLGYGYPVWYQSMDIRSHISQYAPQHPYKAGFSQLPAEQHHQAFAQIADAVHSGGVGLEQIDYPGPDGRAVALLDQQEVGHLRDVARLLGQLEALSVLLLPVWALAALGVAAVGPPSRGARVMVVSVAMVVLVMPLLVWGPKAVFYQLHEWLFPPDHPWFFYWNESLMSTLMKAPYLFGGIAALITVLALPVSWVLFRGGLGAATRLLARGSSERN